MPAASLSTRYADRVQQVATGGYWTVVLGKSGHVYAYQGYSKPMRVPGLSGVSVEVTAATDKQCVRLQGGGVEVLGIVSRATAPASSPTPVDATGITNAVRLAGGGYAVCAILASGGVRCWGQEGSCLFGTCSYSGYPTPTPIPGLGDVVQMSIAQHHQCAVLASNAVACWGRDNLIGKLGDGTFDVHTSPLAPAYMQLPPGPPGMVSVNDAMSCLSDGAYGFRCAGIVPGGAQGGTPTPVFVATPYPVVSLESSRTG